MIITTDHGPVRELKLNRPPANALSPALIVALRDAITTAPNGGARALVLSGTPGMFSGGLDVPQWLTLDRPALAQAWRDFYSLLRALACSPIPVAAAINGHGPAGGKCSRFSVTGGPWRKATGRWASMRCRWASLCLR